MLGNYKQEMDMMKQELEKMKRDKAQSPPRQKYLPRMVIVDPPKKREMRKSLPPPVV